MTGKRNEKARFRAVMTGLFIVVLAAAFAVLFYIYSRSMKKEVYVFNADYQAGSTVSADMFLKTSIDASLYDIAQEDSKAGAYLGSGEINELIRNADKLKVDVIAGLPATGNLFASSVDGSVETHLSDNLVSVEMSKDRVDGIARVNTGSKVNILASYVKGGKYVTEMIFQDIRVVGTTDDETGRTGSIFVEMGPDDSIKLINALDTKKVTVSIVKDGSYLPLKESELKCETAIEKETLPIYKVVKEEKEEKEDER